LFNTYQGIAAERAKAVDVGDHFPIQYPFTQFDIYSKLNGSVPGRGERLDDLQERIKKIVGGRIVFENNSPMFQRGDELYPIFSTATGIQSFGFLQRFMELGLAESERILILDEPEVHLHPKWQIDYAELIVDMVADYGLKVLVTTHNPYMSKALKLFSDRKLRDEVNFYYSVKEGSLSRLIEDQELEIVSREMAKPMFLLDTLKAWENDS